MKGTNSINYILLIIIALAVVVVASQAATLTGSKADPNSTVSTVSSAGSSSKDYLECTFKCIGHGECKDIRPSGQVCDEKGTSCKDKPTCNVVFNPSKEAMKPEVYSEKESAEKQVTASFEGVFLPGGTIKIKLPPALAKDYDQKDFFVTLTEDNGPCYICGRPALQAGKIQLGAYKIVLTADDKKPLSEKECSLIASKGTLVTSECGVSFPPAIGDKTLPVVTLPYQRDETNIESLLKKDKGYTITLMKVSKDPVKENALEKNSEYVKANADYYKFSTVGSKSDSWSCPPPDVQKNTGYEPEETVVFNFSEGWMNAKDSVEVQIGRRIEGATKPAACDTAPYTFKPTCTLDAKREVKNEKQKNQYVAYSFKMPYRMPDEPAAVSYQVYADGITVNYPKSGTNTEGPMCSTGTEAPSWHCPEKGCYVDTDGKIGDKGKSYIVSAIDRDNGKYPVKVCKYSKADEECSTGCRQLKKGGVKTAECNLPKPDIKSVFITTCKLDAKGECTPDSICGTYTFKDGEYVENAKCLLTFDSYGRKLVTIAVKNDVPAGVADDALKITADKITAITAYLGTKKLEVAPFPIKIRRYDADKNIWKDESIDYSEGLSAVILKPQDYVEYEAMADADGSDSIKNNPHGVGVSITIDPNTKIASDTKLAMPFTYYIFQKCCSDCGSCKALGAEVCAGTDINKGQCGNWCAWDSVRGIYSYCKSK